MKFLYAIISVLITNICFGQITTTKIYEPEVIIENQEYDSLLNFLGEDVNNYIGQEVYLKGKSKSLRAYGYDNFYTDFGKDIRETAVVYKCCDGYNSKYDSLAERYFTVLKIHKHPSADDYSIYEDDYYMELKEKESGDTVYFKYSSKYEHSFPFILVGFFQKQKDLLVGNKYVIRGDNWMSDDEEMMDVNTGKVVDFSPGGIWTCTDLTIEEKYYTLSLLIKNGNGEKITLGLDNIDGNYWVFGYNEAIRYKQKYGNSNWIKILKREIVTGFTEEMARLSWGEPEEINRTSYGDPWIYDGQYLYFKNGKLTSFN